MSLYYLLSVLTNAVLFTPPQMSSLTVESLKAYRDAVDLSCGQVDASIKVW